jgi:hypothetical protein
MGPARFAFVVKLKKKFNVFSTQTSNTNATKSGLIGFGLPPHMTLGTRLSRHGIPKDGIPMVHINTSHKPA